MTAILSKSSLRTFSVQLKELSSEVQEISPSLQQRMLTTYQLAHRLFATPPTNDPPQFYNVAKWNIFPLSDKPLAKQEPEEKLYSAFLAACLIAARKTANANAAAYDVQIMDALKQFASIKRGTFDKASVSEIFAPMKNDPFWKANKELLKITADLYGHKESGCVLC